MIFYIQDMWNADEAICLYRSHGTSAHNMGGCAIHHRHGILRGKLYICHISKEIFISNKQKGRMIDCNDQQFQKWQIVWVKSPQLQQHSAYYYFLFFILLQQAKKNYQNEALLSFLYFNTTQNMNIVSQRENTRQQSWISRNKIEACRS